MAGIETSMEDSVDALPDAPKGEQEENMQVPHEKSIQVKLNVSSALITDADMAEQQVLPNADDVDQRENKRKFDDIHTENQPEASTPLQPVLTRDSLAENEITGISKKKWTDVEMEGPNETSPEEQAEFMTELATFYREHNLEFRPPKFYGELLNLLKLWRAVIRLGGYELVTANKFWRQVGESFHPPKTCTTVSWTFRNFYEKALLEYERRKRQSGELHQLPISSTLVQPISVENEGKTGSYGQGSGRARRSSAARAMEGWHTHRHGGHGEDKNSTPRREKQLKNIGSNKQAQAPELSLAGFQEKQVVTEVTDVGPIADWVKINVRETKDSFEIYALVPGLLREEVHVQSDPAGRLIITGQPEQLDNPWGITPFKKIVSLPSRINPHHTSAVVSLHGRLYVRVPFESGPA